MTENNKNKGGRPMIQEKRSHHIAFRINDSELRMMKEKMQRNGHKDNASFLRALIDEGNLSPQKKQKRINQDVYIGLSRLNNNLNQVARGVNSNPNNTIDTLLLVEIRDMLKELRRDLY